jgi:hypothetical protein
LGNSSHNIVLDSNNVNVNLHLHYSVVKDIMPDIKEGYGRQEKNARPTTGAQSRVIAQAHEGRG